MKRALVCFLTLIVAFSLMSCTTAKKSEESLGDIVVAEPVAEPVAEAQVEAVEPAATEVAVSDAPFVVGDDYTEYAMEGAGTWAPTYEANLRIAAGDDELFNGKVKLTSDGMYVGEFVYAAGLENGFSTDGALDGFIYTMGEYVGGANNCYWTYTINGKSVNWACNEVHVLENDYIEWTFAEMVW